ncbi:Proteophosphoglycan ppg4 [Rhodotorula toruloides ATCC 204091]|uniref:Proteophosphoglycan ppg4 n=1 Tax=Rhodotorula toruloides TaxID=5286 RepID=A0A2T0A6X4_RHOTO|nr:Proteophosphoglycan ppg4 [Rhodotorula toruloides ATCC 204091]PRQ73762.1 Proteophosphoglycan ppg4 [Rhodotorula toruloides]
MEFRLSKRCQGLLGPGSPPRFSSSRRCLLSLSSASHAMVTDTLIQLATSMRQAVSRRLGWTGSSDLLRLPDELLYHICAGVADADKQARMRGDWKDSQSLAAMSRTCRRVRGPALRALLFDPSERIFEGVDKAAATRGDWHRLCALVDLLRAQPYLGQYIQHLDALAEIAYAKFAEREFTWSAEVDGVLVRLLAMSPNLRSVDVFPVKKKAAVAMKWLDVLRMLRRLDLVIVTDPSPEYTLRHLVFPFLSYRKIPSRVRLSIENFRFHGHILAHHRHAVVAGNTSLSITEGGVDDAESWRHHPLSFPKLQHLTLAPPALPLCLSRGLAPPTLQSFTIRTSSMLRKRAVEDRDVLEKFWIDRYQPFLSELHQLPALERMYLELAPFNADILRALGHVAPALRRLVFRQPAWRGAAVRNAETDADILDAISSLNMLRRLEVLTVPDDDEPDVLPATKAYCKTRGIDRPAPLRRSVSLLSLARSHNCECWPGLLSLFCLTETFFCSPYCLCRCAVFEFSPSSSSSAHGPRRATTASQDTPTAILPPHTFYEPVSPIASRPSIPRAMSSAILYLPEELLDLICDYVVELERDGIVTTLALLSTCRRLFPSARRALWFDPTRILRRHGWDRALLFQNVLLKKPDLGRLIVHLDWLVEVHSALYEARVNHLSIENWTRHLLSACPGLRSLAVFPSIESEWPAELTALSSLRHLTIAARWADAWFERDWTNYFAFLDTLDPIILPPLALCLNRFEIWSDSSHQQVPLDLRNVGRMTVRPEYHAGLGFLPDILPTASYATNRQFFFPFHALPRLSVLRHLILHFVRLDYNAFCDLVDAAPHLEHIDFKYSGWDGCEWDYPPELINAALASLLGDLPLLRFLDLGVLPVANYRSPMRPLTEYCAGRGIEFQWRPVAGPLPGYEVAGDPGEIIDPGPLDEQDEIEADIRHPRAVLQREPQLGDVDLSDALVEDPFGSAPSSREATPAEARQFQIVFEDLSDSSNTDSSSTPSPPSSPDYLPAPLDDPRLASDYEARDTVDEPDEEPWWDWSRPCDFEAADKAWRSWRRMLRPGRSPFHSTLGASETQRHRCVNGS